MGIASEMRKLTQDIAASHEDRTQRIAATKGEAQRLRGEAQDLVTSFQTSRKEAEVQLRKDLAQETAHRESQVKGMMKDARQTIASFSSQRKEMGTELRKELVASQLASKSEVTGLLKKTQNLVKDWQRSREDASHQQSQELAQDRAHLQSEVNKMRNDFGKARAELRADLKAAAVAWQELTQTVRTESTGVKVPPKVAAEEIPDLETKLLAAINKHPEGITLTEVADRLGVAPIVLGRASRSLLEKSKVRKEDKFYFPATGS